MSAAKRATLVVALLGVLGIAAGLALAASGPPTPVITAKPASFTASTSASFSFTDTQDKVTFVCSLDGAVYSACSSPKPYTGLSGGSHTFGVEAVSAGKTGNAATYSWTVVVVPPSISITSPADGGYYNGTGWSAGCGGVAGVCGSASDPSRITSVIVSIKQNATGKYWSGSAYSSTAEAYQSATLTSAEGHANWFYGVPLPAPDGQYTLHVRATDGVGLQTSPGSPATSVFTVDTAPPPAPSITSRPANPTNQTGANFGFSDTESGVSYLCRLDSSSYVSCTSPKVYTSLSPGSHTFFVEARDQAGNTSPATPYRWLINTTPPAPPVITGHPTNPTTSTSATFTFTELDPDNDGDNDHGTYDNGSPAIIAFQCQLDTGPGQTCTSPISYTALSTGNHTFSVRALDTAGNVSAPATFTWTIQQTTGMPFTITGNAIGLLYPGAGAKALAVKLTNPNGVAIYVTSLTATLQSSGLPSGCTTSNFTIVQSTIPSAGVNVPANGSVTLPAQGATAPTIQMVDTHANQNACASATLTIAYSGSSHS